MMMSLPSALRTCVITSYSIHYTKLYESSGPAQAGDDRRFARLRGDLVAAAVLHDHAAGRVLRAVCLARCYHGWFQSDLGLRQGGQSAAPLGYVHEHRQHGWLPVCRDHAAGRRLDHGPRLAGRNNFV